jgi:hypothetical protein
MDGSFLYVNGTRGTFSIGRDGDVELHGPSEIQGIADRLTGEKPWITGFSYIQASDFLDEDGNSIAGAGGNIQDGAADGSQDGIIATWNSASDQWQPNDAVAVDANGNVGIKSAPNASAGSLIVNAETDLNVAINSVDYAGEKKARISAFNDAVSAGVPLAIEGSELRLRTGMTDQLTIDASGNVGIGNAGTVTPNSQGASLVVDTGKNDDGMTIVGSNSSSIFFADAAEARAGRILYLHSTDEMSFYTNGNAQRLTIDTNGDATFTGNAFFGNAAAVYGQFSNDMVLGTTDCTAVTPLTNGQADLGGVTNQWKDGYFSGAVEAAGGFTVNSKPIMQTLTQAEYDNLTPNADTVYFIV